MRIINLVNKKTGKKIKWEKKEPMDDDIRKMKARQARPKFAGGTGGTKKKYAQLGQGN